LQHIPDTNSRKGNDISRRFSAGGEYYSGDQYRTKQVKPVTHIPEMIEGEVLGSE